MDDEKIVLQIEADRAAVARTNRALDEVSKNLSEVKKTADTVTGDGLRDVRVEAEKAAKAVDNLAQKAERAQKAQQMPQAPSGGGGLGGSTGKAAGKVGGVLGQVGGAIGGDVGGALGQVGETLQTVASSGLKAGAALGVASIALGAVVLAVNEFNRVVGEAQAALQARYDAERDVLNMIARGATVEDAKARVAELERVTALESDILKRRQQDLESAFKQLQQSVPIVGDLIARIAKQLGIFRPIEDEIKKSEEAISRAKSEIEILNDSLEAGRFASKPTEQAPPAASAAAAAVAQIAPASEAASQAVTAHNEAMREQEQAAQRAQQAQESYARAIGNANKSLRDSLSDIARNAKQARADAQKSLRDDFRAQERKLADDRREAQVKAQEEELKVARDFNRQLRDVKRDAIRTEQDLIAERDFLGLRNLKRDTERRLADERQAFDDEAQERAIARAQEAQERQRAFADERRERQIAYQQQLRDLAENTRRQQEQARIAYRRQVEQAQAELRLAQQTGQQRLNILGEVARAEIGVLSQLRDAVSGRPTTNITNNNRAIQQNNQFNISGSNARAISDEVLRVINGLGY